MVITLQGLLIKQFNMIASNQQYTNFSKEPHESITVLPNNKTEILIEYDDMPEESTFAAKPAYVYDDTDKKIEEIIQSAYQTDITVKDELKSPTNLSMDASYISSSSMDDSIKIYNVPTGEIINGRSDNKDKVSAQSDAVEGNYNIDMIDNTILENSVSSLSTDGVVDESLVIVDNLDSLKEEDHLGEVEDNLPQLPKVKELAKKFVVMESFNDPAQVGI